MTEQHHLHCSMCIIFGGYLQIVGPTREDDRYSWQKPDQASLWYNCSIAGTNIIWGAGYCIAESPVNPVLPLRTGWETFGNEQIWYLPLKWMYLHGEAWIKVAIHMHLNPWQSSFVTTALHQIIAFLHLQRSDTWALPAFITLCSITGEDARTPLSLKMKQQNIPHGVFSFLLLESINIFFWQWNTPLDKLVSEAHNNWWIKPSRVS